MIAGTDGALLAALIAEAGRGPSGSEDLSNYTGQILAWDEISGTNVVRVNGTDIPNMRVVQSGIGLSYRAGEVVNITRRGTQWFVNGKVGAPGAGAGNQIASSRVPEGSGDIPVGGGFAELPARLSASVYIGSSRRCLVMHSFEMDIFGTAASAFSTIGVWQAVEISGASSAPVETAVTDAYKFEPLYGGGTVMASTLVTKEQGLNPGLNTFTAKYRAERTEGLKARVKNRVLTVIPF
ncbi:hypothetical protein [Amycolatopsis echigonensis]|uniref:Uncharacterized protein n=1 Tax=Amycolatopsis echigonensis TaxID=2576905 RepID=A0A8E1VXZ6_9PSEU|nr:hypothetical protein [Amycolatopsis echigonensis]MBB2500256.1 hypothetical protein [Amycolatopsis echigonensis]